MDDDRVRVLEFRFGYFPQLFTWRGGRWGVTAVRQVWCESREWPRLRQVRSFVVQTSAGPFELRHDLLRDRWAVRRAPAAARRAAQREARRGAMAPGGQGHGRGLVVAR